MFLVVSQSDVHIDFDFAQPYCFACPTGRTSKIARPKNRACRSKFVQPWAKKSTANIEKRCKCVENCISLFISGR